ncbi:MAG: nucleoside-diphosphate kinase [Candidatus Cloacimonadaceae bacterium]|jgi:nucleoside-diphosphate kinase|nr:nucleoside-diphosphate kinase [Candidatus Cloacimonadota bacterium]MDY0128478.1 nucleoside-diphosphate kinase [Candidatus Cloacimonadaceae bacterium]MCB5254195.1 nucleoside-diphosphate kinase [Candidatus Cloacimonadota bacterium]MCK9179093.1 nucleoside-diphosphate kinase [Candidatus Cloacimonadota bacterium]MDD3102637.1 nucleoside-diphosphate kinase [Candidatus Cloacimonadota bacterium]
MIEQSLFLIKPNAVMRGHVGQIITMLEDQGFAIVKMKLFRFDEELARIFYAEHIGKEFYPRLQRFMCSGNTVALLLERENAIKVLRELIGDLSPEKRKPGTIRALYGDGVTENGAHASDSLESAKRETEVIFGA